MTLQGRFPSDVVRPPLRPLSVAEMSRIAGELKESGYDEWQAELQATH